MTTHPDDDLPSVARIYDYLLGGAHNFAADRAQADALIAEYPSFVTAAWANRNFLRHAVEHALALGIDQFLDLGSGIPTVGNVHEIALAVNPGARTVYVDNESVAVAHSRELLADTPGATIAHADIRQPERVLTAPELDLLDFSRPVAVLAVALFHFLSDADGPADLVAAYRRPLAAGGVLAMTHGSGDYPGDDTMAEARRQVLEHYASTSHPVHDRSRAEIRGIVESAGFAVDADGLVDLSRWAPAKHDGSPLGAYALITEPLA